MGKPAKNSANLFILCPCCGHEFQVSPSRLNKKFYCSQKCYGESQRISKRELKPYPRAYIGKGLRVHIHRHLMEEKLGRKLETWEHVHHINGDVEDNRLENLQLMTIEDHGRLSTKERHLARQKKDKPPCH